MDGRGEGTAARRALTGRQAEALGLFRRYVAEHGASPSIRELAAALGVRSTNAVSEQLKTLEKKGYLRRAPGVHARAVVLASEPGRCAACGQVLPAEERPA